MKRLDRNPNQGTERGREAIRRSKERWGVARPVLVDKNEVLLAGNHFYDEVENDPEVDVQIVDTTGNELVVVVRDDLDVIDDPTVRGVSHDDNRSHQLNLSWDKEILRQDRDKLSRFFVPGELKRELDTPSPGVPDIPHPENEKVWGEVLVTLSPPIYALYKQAIARFPGDCDDDKFARLVEWMTSEALTT